jgi:hypothetical protein
MNFWNGVAAVGPLTVQSYTPTYAQPGTPFQLSVWVNP